MNNYLIFRTDRIGDYIFSQILINSISRNDKKSRIYIIASDKNFFYANRFKNVYKVLLFKKKLFILIKLFFFLNKINFKKIIILDGKRRSFLFSLLIKSQKIALIKNNYLFFLSKIFNIKFFVNLEDVPLINSLKKILEELKFNLFKSDLNIHKEYQFKKELDWSFLKKRKHNLHLHIDEKWFTKFYYKDYTNIDLNYKKLILLLKFIINNFKCNVIITTGSVELPIINSVKNNFYKFSKDIYFKDFSNHRVFFHDKLNFFDLENIIRLSKYLICCEGSISHLSYSFKIRTFALIEKKRETFYKHWTAHMKENIKLIYRTNIVEIIKQIKSNINFFKN
jgi:ADP-heptose:LPS heptosyltransferase